MTNTPTLAEFLAQPSEPEDVDLDELQETLAAEAAVSTALAESAPDLLHDIAQSLSTIAEGAYIWTYLDKKATELADELADTQRALADVRAAVDIQDDLIARVLEVVKPSTSKLADNVRAVLQPKAEEIGVPVVVSPTGEVQTLQEFVHGEHNNEADAPPAADAKVEEWRAYARSRGYTGADVDKANRSQIRTMLGVEHFDPGPA